MQKRYRRIRVILARVITNPYCILAPISNTITTFKISKIYFEINIYLICLCVCVCVRVCGGGNLLFDYKQGRSILWYISILEYFFIIVLWRNLYLGKKYWIAYQEKKRIIGRPEIEWALLYPRPLNKKRLLSQKMFLFTYILWRPSWVSNKIIP